MSKPSIAERRRVSDAACRAAVDLFGEKGVVDMVAARGYYELVAMALNVDRHPLPDGAQPAFPDTAR